MYALVALLGMLVCGTFGRAYVLAGTDAAPSRALRRRWAAAFAVALAALMYTHNWALFFAAGCGLTWLALVGRRARRGAARAAARRRARLRRRDRCCSRRGCRRWPSRSSTPARRGRRRPGSSDLLAVPGRLLGTVAQLGLLLAAGDRRGGRCSNRGAGRLGARGRALLAMGGLFVGHAAGRPTPPRRSRPAWATRYLAVALPPLLLLVAGGLAHAGRLGLVGALLVALIWAGDGAPTEKSNVRAISEEIAPSLKPGDVVVSTQPEQIPVLSYYLPAGPALRDAVGPGRRPRGHRLARRRASGCARPTPRRTSSRCSTRCRSGRRIVLVEPIINNLARWRGAVDRARAACARPSGASTSPTTGG